MQCNKISLNCLFRELKKQEKKTFLNVPNLLNTIVHCKFKHTFIFQEEKYAGTLSDQKMFRLHLIKNGITERFNTFTW